MIAGSIRFAYGLSARAALHFDSMPAPETLFEFARGQVTILSCTFNGAAAGPGGLSLL